MTRLLIRWILTALAVFAVSRIVPGIEVQDFRTALAAAAVLGVLNLFVKPILVLLTLPITVLSLGLFLLVINALLFELAGSIVGGLHVASFWSALGASVFVSVVSWLTQISVNRAGGKTTFVIQRMPTQEPRSRDLN